MEWPRVSLRPVLKAPWTPGAVLQDLVDRCRESVQEHYTFSHELLEMQQWVTLVTQKLESHRKDTGPWDTQSQEAKIEVKWLSLQRCCTLKAGLRD